MLSGLPSTIEYSRWTTLTVGSSKFSAQFAVCLDGGKVSFSLSLSLCLLLSLKVEISLRAPQISIAISCCLVGHLAARQNTRKGAKKAPANQQVGNLLSAQPNNKVNFAKLLCFWSGWLAGWL